MTGTNYARRKCFNLSVCIFNIFSVFAEVFVFMGRDRVLLMNECNVLASFWLSFIQISRLAVFLHKEIN